jgi:murein DD-endopeptidase MepM/ murein hydrolase activator NlpD
VKIHAAHATPNDPTGAVKAPKDERKAASQQLEAFFLRQLLTEAQPEGSSDGGFAGDTFKQMLNEQLADNMSKAGGIGLAKMVAPSLGAGPAIPASELPAQREMSHPSMEIDHTALPFGSAAGPGQARTVDGALPPAMMAPIAGRPSSGYGLRMDPIKGGLQRHPGVDLPAVIGTPVSAAAGGTVTHAGPAGTYGNLVTIKHENGFETRYAHLSEVDVKEGAKVAPGELVGKVGTTGYSTGPHLHFEVRHDGKVLDPADLLPPLNRSPDRTTR